jgi:hypothetical protein
MIMSKTFKIIGAGKGARSTYKSLAKAKSIIEEGNIAPLAGDDFISVIETKVTAHKIKVVKPLLSDDNKTFLVNYVLKNLDSENLNGDLYNPSYKFKYYERDKRKITGFMFKWVKENKGLEKEEILEGLKSEDYYYTDMYKKLKFEYPSTQKMYTWCIKQLLKETKLEDLQFICNITNFKPCHNILIEATDISLQIRVKDFVWDYGHCYGRNASLLKSIDLSDRIFPKWKKDLNI